MVDNKDILKIGKSTFLFSITSGSFLFFSLFSGYMVEFVIFSGWILCLYALLNALIFLGLIIYGLIYQSKLLVCLKSALWLLINIPVSFIYSSFIDN